MKRLQKTDFINNLLASAVGVDVDTTNFPVWEVVATSTVPLRGKTGTIFEGAVIKPSTLFQLSAVINRDALPLMQDHNMEGSPKGKLFYSEVLPNEFGQTELRGFVYADPTEADLAAKMDNGTVDETSIAFAAKQMLCNKCGWDYALAIENDNIMPVFERTCENGHKIGKDGTHLELEGVRDALELSVVSRGAAKNSKIVGQSESKLSKQVERLAAHGLSINDRYVTASASKGLDDMDMNDLIVQLSDAKSKATTAERERDKLAEEHAEAVGARNEAETRVRELEQQLAEANQKASEAPTAEERQVAEKDAKDVKLSSEFLAEQYTAVLTAAGKKDFEVPESVDELIAGIKEHKAELSAVLPIGGAARGANEEDEAEVKPDFSAFRAQRHSR